jgi:hypothetical protein
VTGRSAFLSLAAAVLLATTGVIAQHQHGATPAPSGDTLGTGVTLAEVTSIAALHATPEKFVGKTIRLDGVVTAVCTEMGCWMALSAEGHPDQTVRFKVDHDAGIVFPISAKGKPASAQGTFEKIAATDTEGKDAAAEQQAVLGKASDFGATYQIKATGAVIK